MGRGAVNGGVNYAEQTSQDILEVPLSKPKTCLQTGRGVSGEIEACCMEGNAGA